MAESDINRDNPHDILTQNPFVKDLIADGRLRQRPCKTSTNTTLVIPVDFDALYNRLVHIITSIYTSWDSLLNRYVGTTMDDRLTQVETDTKSMVCFALWALYNRLRSIAEFHHTSTRINRMENRAPVSSHFLFPTTLARIINSIGWLDIVDAPCEYSKIVFTVKDGTSYNYGRSTAQTPHPSGYLRLLDSLVDCGVSTGAVDMNVNYITSAGCFWPTCRGFESPDKLLTVVSTFHASHYTTEDAILGLLLAPMDREEYGQPFPDFSLNAEMDNGVDQGREVSGFYATILLKDLGPWERYRIFFTAFRASTSVS